MNKGSRGQHLLEFDYYRTPDGVLYDLSNFELRWLLSQSGEGMPPIDYRTQRGPFQHGVTLLDYFLKPRVVQAVAQRQATCRQDYWDMRADMLNYLRPNRQAANTLAPGQLRKIMPDGTTRDLDVLIQSGPGFEGRGADWEEWSVQELLRFTAFDPVFYDPTQQSLTFILAATNNLVFPITFPIQFGGSVLDYVQTVTYAGTWLSYPSIILTGPLNTAIVENQTTGESITFTYNIPAGRVVTIDLAYGAKTVADDLGTNLIGNIDPASDLATFHLAPDPEAAGGVNTLHLTASGLTGDSGISLIWYARYIGI